MKIFSHQVLLREKELPKTFSSHAPLPPINSTSVKLRVRPRIINSVHKTIRFKNSKRIRLVAKFSSLLHLLHQLCQV